MAHVRKDTRVAPIEWWKHLRPFNKRLQAKAERRVARLEIDEEDELLDTPKGLGLHNDPAKMLWMKEHEGESVIPEGVYCYYGLANCPYWDRAENKSKQVNGFCWFLGKGDWDEGIGELWDQVKCCGIKSSFHPEGTISVYDDKEVV
jgi:hypothetical protein